MTAHKGSMAQGLQKMLAMCRCIERDAGRILHQGAVGPVRGLNEASLEMISRR